MASPDNYTIVSGAALYAGRAAPSSGLPAYATGLAQWQWVAIPGGKYTDVTPSGSPGGSFPLSLNAYGGLACDRLNGKIFSVDQGGHADYAGNPAISYDAMQASPSWTILRQPTPAAQVTFDTPYYADGSPSSSHTYWGQHFIRALNRVFRFGSAYWGSGVSGYQVDAFNLATNNYDAAGTWASIQSGARSTGGKLTCCQDAATDDVYVVGGYNLIRYSGTTGARSDLGAMADPFQDQVPSAVDTTRNRVVFFGKQGDVSVGRYYNISAGTFSAQFSFTGAPASMAAGPSVEYVAAIDKFVVKDATGGGIQLVDPVTWVFSTQATTGTTVPDGTTSSGIWNRCRYVPALGGFIYYPTTYPTDLGAFFLKVG